jgi:hypothetical protein
VSAYRRLAFGVLPSLDRDGFELCVRMASAQRFVDFTGPERSEVVRPRRGSNPARLNLGEKTSEARRDFRPTGRHTKFGSKAPPTPIRRTAHMPIRLLDSGSSLTSRRSSAMIRQGRLPEFLIPDLNGKFKKTYEH